MNWKKSILLIFIIIPVFLLLVWIFAVPVTLIQDNIDAALKSSGNKNIEIEFINLSKGIFFSLHADSLTVNIDQLPALVINDLTCTFAPDRLLKKDIAFRIRGGIGDGTLNGILMLTAKGNVRIKGAGLDAVPYIARFGGDIKGNLSSDIRFENETVHVLFEIPDLDIRTSPLTSIPLLKTYRRIQGSLVIKNNSIRFESVGLEGSKGYARLKGSISKGIMNLSLELMPTAGSLNAGESLLLGRYTVSPGYYVIPIKGPLKTPGK